MPKITTVTFHIQQNFFKKEKTQSNKKRKIQTFHIQVYSLTKSEKRIKMRQL